jgi:RNA polymerase sigma-70 factor (ECF subfamily)
MDRQLDPDAALMLKVAQGDTEAFAELVDKYKGPVISLASRMIQDPSEAEDLAQAAFVQVYKSASRYRASSKFSTWLFTIARNLCLNEIRRRGRHPAHSLEGMSESAEEGGAGVQLADQGTAAPAEAMLQNELQLKIEEALQELPETQRTAILLCRQDELSYDDIAEVLGVSVSAVKSLIHRGREAMKARLKPYLRSGFWDTPPE